MKNVTVMILMMCICACDLSAMPVPSSGTPDPAPAVITSGGKFYEPFTLEEKNEIENYISISFAGMIAGGTIYLQSVINEDQTSDTVGNIGLICSAASAGTITFLLIRHRIMF